MNRITKKVLLAMICDLNDEIDCLQNEIEDIKKTLEKPKPIKRGENIDGVKRKPGRPRKTK